MNILPINIYSNNTTPSFGASAKTTVAVAKEGGKAVKTVVMASIGAASAAAVAGQVLVNKDSIIKKTEPAVDIDVLKEKISGRRDSLARRR